MWWVETQLYDAIHKTENKEKIAGKESIHFWDTLKKSFPFHSFTFVKLQVLGLGLGVDFTFALDNNENNENNDNNPHLNFLKGTVLGDKE